MSVAGISLGAGAGALTFTSPGSGGAKVLTIGSAGIVNSSSNVLTFDISTKVNIVLSANASFTANDGAIVINDEKTAAIKLNIGSYSLTLSGVNAASSIAQDFGGSGSIIKSGTGTWTLSGNNVYTGTTSVTEGTLNVSNLVVGGTTPSSNLGNATSKVVLGGSSTKGTLAYNGTTATYTRGFTVNGGGGEFDVVNSGQTITIGTGTIDATGVFTVGGAGDTTINSAISGTGGLAKAGSGALVLAAGNSFTGGTTLISGTLTVNSGATLAAAASGLTVNSGTLNLNNAAQTVASLSGNGGTINLGSGHTLTDNQTTNTTFSGAITGSGNFVKSGAGRVQLTGANNYSGTTTINGGILQFGGTAALYNGNTGSWTAANLIVNAGATAAFNVGGTGEFTAANIDTLKALGTGSGGFQNGSFIGFDTTNAGGTFTYNSNITDLNAGANKIGVVKLGAGTLVLGGSNTYSGDTNVKVGTLKLGAASALSPNTKLNVDPGATFDANGFSQTVSNLSGSGNLSVGSGLTVQPASGTSTTFSGQLTGTGGFTMNGAGTLTLAASNSFSGATVISAGTLVLGAAGALPSTTPVTLSSGATLDLGGYATTIAKLAGTGGTVALNGANLVVNQTDSSSFAGALSGTGTLSKQGSGLLELTGNQTSFTGSTQISGGQLKLNGSLANSAVTLSGGVLSGNGTVGALTISSGGVLAPGNSPGTMNSGSTTWAGGGTFNFEINKATGTAGSDPGWDILNITGGLTVTATSSAKFTISVISLTLANATGFADSFNSGQNYSFTLAKTTGGITGFDAAAFTIDTSSFQNSFSGAWSIAQSGSDLNLVYTASAIPEPSTYAALFGGVILLFVGVRRRRR